MIKHMFEKTVLRIDGEELVCESIIKDVNAVILHGAGTSNRGRYYSLANELLSQGVGVILFDFSGHGDSSGQLSELSLQRRQLQATSVIEALVPNGELYILGFSMGAQTACSLLPAYGQRTRALLLGCPAIYTEQAIKIPFGNQEFTDLIRAEKSWESSGSLERLHAYKRKVLLAVGSEDEVIPKGVVSLLKQANDDVLYVEYPGVGHQLVHWLSGHPKAQHELVKRLVN
jgi:pimeloyl-ACP methyl ester carboxylesterase